MPRPEFEIDYTNDGDAPEQVRLPAKKASRIVSVVGAGAALAMAMSQDTVSDVSSDSSPFLSPDSLVTTSQFEPNTEMVVGGRSINNLSKYFEDEEDISNTEVRDHVVSSYRRYREGVIDQGEIGLLIDNSAEAISELQQERYQVVTLGIDMVRRYYGKAEAIQMDVETGVVQIEGSRAFNLANTTDLVLLDRYMQYVMSDDESSGGRAPEEEILELANADITIVVDEDAFAFDTSDGLLILSRLMKEFDPRVHPDTVQFSSPVGYPGLGGRYYADENRIMIVRPSMHVMAHEFGHAVGYRHDVYGHDDFSDVVGGESEAFQQYGYVIGDEEHIDSYAKKNDREDFAVAFEWLYVEGIHFREELKKRYLSNDPAYSVFKTRYVEMRRVFGGEFLTDGIEFNPQTGDIFEIRDPDTTGRGILLQSEPTFIKGPEMSSEGIVIKDGDSVTVIRETVALYNPHTQMDTRMAYVELSDGRVGWVDVLWFGDLMASGAIGPRKN